MNFSIIIIYINFFIINSIKNIRIVNGINEQNKELSSVKICFTPSYETLEIPGKGVFVVYKGHRLIPVNIPSESEFCDQAAIVANMDDEIWDNSILVPKDHEEFSQLFYGVKNLDNNKDELISKLNEFLDKKDTSQELNLKNNHIEEPIIPVYVQPLYDQNLISENSYNNQKQQLNKNIEESSLIEESSTFLNEEKEAIEIRIFLFLQFTKEYLSKKNLTLNISDNKYYDEDVFEFFKLNWSSDNKSLFFDKLPDSIWKLIIKNNELKSNLNKNMTENQKKDLCLQSLNHFLNNFEKYMSNNIGQNLNLEYYLNLQNLTNQELLESIKNYLKFLNNTENKNMSSEFEKSMSNSLSNVNSLDSSLSISTSTSSKYQDTSISQSESIPEISKKVLDNSAFELETTEKTFDVNSILIDDREIVGINTRINWFKIFTNDYLSRLGINLLLSEESCDNLNIKHLFKYKKESQVFPEGIWKLLTENGFENQFSVSVTQEEKKEIARNLWSKFIDVEKKIFNNDITMEKYYSKKNMINVEVRELLRKYWDKNETASKLIDLSKAKFLDSNNEFIKPITQDELVKNQEKATKAGIFNFQSDSDRLEEDKTMSNNQINSEIYIKEDSEQLQNEDSDLKLLIPNIDETRNKDNSLLKIEKSNIDRNNNNKDSKSDLILKESESIMDSEYLKNNLKDKQLTDINSVETSLSNSEEDDNYFEKDPETKLSFKLSDFNNSEAEKSERSNNLDKLHKSEISNKESFEDSKKYDSLEQKQGLEFLKEFGLSERSQTSEQSEEKSQISEQSEEKSQISEQSEEEKSELSEENNSFLQFLKKNETNSLNNIEKSHLFVNSIDSENSKSNIFENSKKQDPLKNMDQIETSTKSVTMEQSNIPESRYKSEKSSIFKNETFESLVEPEKSFKPEELQIFEHFPEETEISKKNIKIDNSITSNDLETETSESFQIDNNTKSLEFEEFLEREKLQQLEENSKNDRNEISQLRDSSNEKSIEQNKKSEAHIDFQPSYEESIEETEEAEEKEIKPIKQKLSKVFENKLSNLFSRTKRALKLKKKSSNKEVESEDLDENYESEYENLTNMIIYFIQSYAALRFKFVNEGVIDNLFSEIVEIIKTSVHFHQGTVEFDNIDLEQAIKKIAAMLGGGTFTALKALGLTAKDITRNLKTYLVELFPTENIQKEYEKNKKLNTTIYWLKQNFSKNHIIEGMLPRQLERPLIVETSQELVTTSSNAENIRKRADEFCEKITETLHKFLNDPTLKELKTTDLDCLAVIAVNEIHSFTLSNSIYLFLFKYNTKYWRLLTPDICLSISDYMERIENK